MRPSGEMAIANTCRARHQSIGHQSRAQSHQAPAKRQVARQQQGQGGTGRIASRPAVQSPTSIGLLVLSQPPQAPRNSRFGQRRAALPLDHLHSQPRVAGDHRGGGHDRDRLLQRVFPGLVQAQRRRRKHPHGHARSLRPGHAASERRRAGRRPRTLADPASGPGPSTQSHLPRAQDGAAQQPRRADKKDDEQ